MGLFKKRATDPTEIERLKTEIAAMGARLEAAHERLATADERLAAADERLAAADERLATADARLAVNDRRLDDVDAVKAELGEQVRSIVTRLDTPIAPPPRDPPPPSVPPPAPPPPSSPTNDPAELAKVHERLAELVVRLEGVDARITAISTELANQIDELSSEMAGVGDTAPTVTDEIVGELRDAQTRLANEQARYQIAFRHDLAELADRLKRH